MEETITIPCGECGGEAMWYPSSEHVYRSDYGPIYLCQCGASVGTHHRGKKPLGTPAGKETRERRKEVHALFDPIWQSGRFSRKGLYSWLASELEIDRKDCHIGLFDSATCLRAAAILKIKLNAGTNND